MQNGPRHCVERRPVVIDYLVTPPVYDCGARADAVAERIRQSIARPRKGRPPVAGQSLTESALAFIYRRRFGENPPDYLVQSIIRDFGGYQLRTDGLETAVDRRAWYLAGFAPKDLTNDPIKPRIARELLIRYGDRDDVQRNLIANFSSGGWMGSESEHYRSEKEALESLLEAEGQPQVREWVRRYVGLLRKSVEQARIEEEREDI